VPADLAAVCLKCLEKNPALRYATAAALAHDLDRFLRGEAVAARELTLWSQTARLLRHSQLDVNWGAWATLSFYLAPLPLVSHVAVFVFFRNGPAYGPVAIGVSLATAAVLLGSVYLGKAASLRRVAPAQRRRLMSTWLGHLIGMILVLVTIVRMTHPSTPEEWFVIYALWLIQVGGVFGSLAANAGILYVTASLCFVLALLAPFVPFYMPLVVGSLMSLNMTTHGLILRRVAREAAAP
jgi:hypothetical protein